MVSILKKILIFLLFIFQFIFSYASSIINIHYKRYNNDYSNWNLWVWENGKDGKVVEFTGSDDYGKIATIKINDPNTSSIGFIIKKGEWEDKDIGKDRFIPIKDEITNVYLLEGDETIYPSKESVNFLPKIKNASFVSNNKVEFNLTTPIKLTDISIFKIIDNSNNEIKIKSIDCKDYKNCSNAILILEKPFDISKNYTLQIKGFKDISISKDSFYSSKEFENKYFYNKSDLGVTLKKDSTSFKVWAPTAEKVVLNIFKEGTGENLLFSTPMKKIEKGCWYLKIDKNLENFYYTYSITTSNTTNEAVDLYAKALGINGKRGMIVDLEKTNPKHWNSTKKPKFKNPTDAIVYEIHVRDFSMDNSSGIKNKGKFLGMVEKNSKNSSGLSTGLDHLKELEVTHIQILPSFDYASINEENSKNSFNWGYDPENYNVPEGSYSSNPYIGTVRIKEFKEMVQELHKNGIRVIMDVVFNHTAKTSDSNFNKTVPDYFYRKENGNFSNASGCGNETASERAMVRKYIVDSVVFWAKEYKIDGFRFDLMGIHDIETMNEIRSALNKVDPTIIIYGEPWTASSSPYPEEKRAVKINTSKLNGIGVFNDDIRDGIKGHVFNATGKGFATGLQDQEERIKFGVVGACSHPQVTYAEPWAKSPIQSINYVSAHDNLTLWDKIATSNKEDSRETRVAMNKLSASIVFLSQGIPFFQGGEEILRSKPLPNGGFDENSYKSPDSINSIKWDEKTTNIDVFNYYKGLIAFRKATPELRMTSQKEIKKNIVFFENLPKNVVAFKIKKNLIVIFNANKEEISFNLPKGDWKIFINKETAGTKPLNHVKNVVSVPSISAMVLKK